MLNYSLTHLDDAVLLREGAASAARESASTAAVLAHIGEIEARRLYAAEGYDSMCAFCVGEWGLCEYAAYRRIGAARAARKHPAIFAAVADGRLNLTAINLLAPELTPGNADELLAAAARKTKRQIQDLLAGRSARPAAPAREERAGSGAPLGELAPALVAPGDAVDEGAREEPLAPAPAAALPAPPRFPLHAQLGQAERDDLEYLKALLGHAVPSGNLAQVLGRVFKAAIRELEREKFAVTSRSRRAAPQGSANPRHVPAAVRRAVLERDAGRCTFVSEKGHRCESRRRLELDHATPVAKGGQSTADNVRLRCRTHNQHAAEQAFGAGFMRRKRAEAGRAAAKRQAAARAADAEKARREARARELAANEAARARALEVIPWLRTLGFRADEARRSAARCEALPEAPLEERVRFALQGLAPASARRVTAVASNPG